MLVFSFLPTSRTAILDRLGLQLLPLALVQDIQGSRNAGQAWL